MYAFCEGDPENLLDISGCLGLVGWFGGGHSRIIITTTYNEVCLKSPTLDEFRGAISAIEDFSIKSITIYDHGWINRMHIDGNGIGVEVNSCGDVVFEDDGSSLSTFLLLKMASQSNIYLSGCMTAYDGWFNDGNNISRSLSMRLPNVTVSGNRKLAIGYNGETTWNIGVKRSYQNGKEL